MDKKLLNLHTAARRHCINIIKNHEWDKEADFYYFQVYEAILMGIELLRPKDYKFFESFKKDIIYMSEITDNESTFHMKHSGQEIEVNKYRHRFKEFIMSLTPENVENTEPLYYRRMLREEELDSIKKNLLNYWSGKDEGWFPVFDLDFEKDLLNFNSEFFRDSGNLSKLKSILVDNKIDLLYEFRWGMDYGVSYEMDVECFIDSFYIDPFERFWTTKDFSSVFYVHHDDITGFAGLWIQNEIKINFPNWDKNLFTLNT